MMIMIVFLCVAMSTFLSIALARHAGVAERHKVTMQQVAQGRALHNRRIVAKMEHEELSPEFLAWLADVGDLAHEDCTVCHPPLRVLAYEDGSTRVESHVVQARGMMLSYSRRPKSDADARRMQCEEHNIHDYRNGNYCKWCGRDEPERGAPDPAGWGEYLYDTDE